MRLSDTIYKMMNDARQRVIETMRERDIKVVNLVMTQEEFAKENGFDDAKQAESDYYDYRGTEAPYVIFFDKWGRGTDYAALSVELVDGEHPKFKLNCYNSNEGDDRFYDNDLTWLSMVNVYERMLEELEIKDEPEKVWVLFDESLCDYELQGRRIMVFKSEDEARKKFKEFADESRKTAENNGWEIGSDNDDFFEAYPEGAWGTSHETVELSETTFSESIWCHN